MVTTSLDGLDEFEARLAELAAELDANRVRPDVANEVLREMLASRYAPDAPLSLSADELQRACADVGLVLAAAHAMSCHEHQAVDWFRSCLRAVCRHGSEAAAKHHGQLLALTPEQGSEPLGPAGAALIDEFVAALRLRSLAMKVSVSRYPTEVEVERHFPKWSQVIRFADIAALHRAGIPTEAVLDALAQADFDIVLARAILLDGGAPALNEGLL